MSLANVKLFIDAVEQDPVLQERLAAVSEPAESLRLAVQMGSERGLTFTAEELVASVRSPAGEGSGELSDDQLGAVAGGTLTALGSGKLTTTGGLRVSPMTSLYRSWGTIGGGSTLSGGTLGGF